MATRYWFKWNEHRTDEMNVIMNEAPKIIKPEERIQHVTIPGRSGDVTLTEGDNIFSSYIQTVGIAVHGAANVPAVENWLKGAGMVRFSSQPGFEQRARIVGAVELQKHSRHLDWWEGDVQFYCDPIKTDVDEQTVSVTTSGTSINNPGDMTALPLIEITGSGAVTVACGGNTLVIPNCTSGWVIDSENEWILSGSTPQEKACSGAFPILQKGTNAITFTGSITKLTVTPRYRYL